VSTGQANSKAAAAASDIAFETRDFYLACFLRCTGYELLDLRAEGWRKVFVFRDCPTRRDDVLAFYGAGAVVLSGEEHLLAGWRDLTPKRKLYLQPPKSQ
jgi:hypothetical protein